MKDQVQIIRDKMVAAQSQQKSYVDTRRRDLAFEEGDWVYIKVSPMKGLSHFEKRGKLSSRFVGPLEVGERIGPLAYRVALPIEFGDVHDVYHVSTLRKIFKHQESWIVNPKLSKPNLIYFMKRPRCKFGRSPW